MQLTQLGLLMMQLAWHTAHQAEQAGVARAATSSICQTSLSRLPARARMLHSPSSVSCPSGCPVIKKLTSLVAIDLALVMSTHSLHNRGSVSTGNGKNRAEVHVARRHACRQQVCSACIQAWKGGRLARERAMQAGWTVHAGRRGRRQHSRQAVNALLLPQAVLRQLGPLLLRLNHLSQLRGPEQGRGRACQVCSLRNMRTAHAEERLQQAALRYLCTEPTNGLAPVPATSGTGVKQSHPPSRRSCWRRCRASASERGGASPSRSSSCGRRKGRYSAFQRSRAVTMLAAGGRRAQAVSAGWAWLAGGEG